MKMKILKIITTTLVLWTVIYSFAFAGAMAPNRTFDLRFVGRSDGMRLTINHGTGDVTGYKTGSQSGPVRGWVANIAGGTYDGLAVVVGYSRDVIIVIGDSPQNWQMKNVVTGTTIASGTWEVGAPLP